ncbi:DMT family transporter [Microvirga puerhi]|uniref:DMT family transporter n=1 Tax=Microvirga puerhi TaxID=2876078 RepID=A0ABS7VRA2_9HYPH|nr:DMT family transporter [Microvirga puerhi]MBZ6077542.1 DMT family transporter [Microvirga puerhi]
MTAPSIARQATPANTDGKASAAQFHGTVLMVVSTVFFACSDVTTKALAGQLPAVEVAWLRYVTFVLMAVPLLLASGGGSALRSHRPSLQILRGLGMVGSALLFTAGLPYLPIAEASAIYFISPILIMALSIPLLGEVVGWRRWSAAFVGLVGMLFVIRPGASTFEAAAILPLLGATSWATAAVVTRKMSGDSAVTTLAYSALVGFVLLSLLLPFVWVTPSLFELGLGLAMGIFSSVGHWLVILAYRQTHASAIAPFSYIQLFWAGTLGYLVFGSVPDSWTIIGACIIALSGLYTAYRERVRAVSKG